jgi:hypothetical protein
VEEAANDYHVAEEAVHVGPKAEDVVRGRGETRRQWLQKGR